MNAPVTSYKCKSSCIDSGTGTPWRMSYFRYPITVNSFAFPFALILYTIIKTPTALLSFSLTHAHSYQHTWHAWCDIPECAKTLQHTHTHLYIYIRISEYVSGIYTSFPRTLFWPWIFAAKYVPAMLSKGE